MNALYNVKATRKLAFAVMAMAIAAVIVAAVAQPASAATPLTGEALTGTGTTSNGSASCGSTSLSSFGHASFSIAGQASGPYPGTFVASGTASVSGRQQAFGVYAYESVSATFTITSGTTTITGNIVASNKLAPVGYYCPTFTIKPSISYTATINGQTYTGTGVTSGSFDTSPAGQASMTASFTDTGSTGGGGTGGGGTGGGGTGGGGTAAPTVTTGSSVNVGTTAATVWGTVDDKGEATTYRFDYGTSGYTLQTISEPLPSSNSTPEDVDARLTGLSPNTVYHYRIEATDLFGTSYGADQTFTTTGTPSADLRTAITASPSNPIVGQDEAFTITVTNDGPDAAQSVAVSDNWTTTSTFRSVSSTAPSGATCAAPPVGSRGTVTCTTASLDLGESITVVVTLRVKGSANQLLQDTATANSTTSDPITANNTATIAPTIT